MASRPSTFRQTDVERALKAACKAGVSVRAVEVTKDGTIRVIMADESAQMPTDSPFDEWKAKRNARQT